MELSINKSKIARVKNEEIKRWSKLNKWKEKKMEEKSSHEKYISDLYGGLLGLRFDILERDNFQCQYCGRSPRKDKCRLEIDHIIPISEGGDSNKENLITSCRECNRGKNPCVNYKRDCSKILNLFNFK